MGSPHADHAYSPYALSLFYEPMDYFCKDCGQIDPLGLPGHHTRCRSNVTIDVTKKVAYCNQCVTKDDEIARLRNQLREAQVKSGDLVLMSNPKRNRAEYMRSYREKRKIQST